MSRFFPGFAIVFLLLAAVLASACGPGGGREESTLVRVLERGELIVGTEAEFPPFESLTDGKLVGFDIDIAKLMAEELGVSVRFEDKKFAALPVELRTGRIDIILSGMTATLDRAKGVTFTDPYFETGLCILLNRETTEGVETIRDLNDPKYTIVAKTGTTGYFAAPRFVPKAKRYDLDKEGNCALEVVTGRADAFLYDMLSVKKHRDRYPEKTRAILTPFTIEPYAAAIRKGDFDWWNWLNQFFATIRRDGRYEEIYQRHLGELLDED
jgi:polar amino acid transport system substrate-binding protein